MLTNFIIYHYHTALPFGQLPILKLNNGFVLSQSQTIGRFLAKKFNLYGKDEFESARIDEICDAIVDHELGNTFGVCLFINGLSFYTF